MLTLATTSVTVIRQRGDGDLDAVDLGRPLAAGMAASFSAPSGSAVQSGGNREQVDMVASLAPSPCVRSGDVLRDETTGDRWTVTWVRQRAGLGLDHQIAGVVAVRGEASG